jgi:hypothetical protein
MYPGAAVEPSERRVSEGSSSINWISGDQKLGLGQKGLYCALNVVNNLIPARQTRSELGVEPFTVPASEVPALIQTADSTSGPARALSDCFVRRQPWAAFRERLGEIHLVDAGCGDGRYARMLRDFSAGAITSYLGFDANEHSKWASLRAPGVDFVRATAESFATFIPENANFFFSHSALEHFREDLAFLSVIRDFIARTKRPTLQIHVVPAPTGLALYCFHGYRQYPAHALLKIRQMFEEIGADVRMYSLGGYRSVSLHWRCITMPGLRGKPSGVGSASYESELRQVLANDLVSPAGPPPYYAVVIDSSSAESRRSGASAPVLFP